MELLPAIDLREGRVVRLVRGEDARRTVYREDPAELLAELAAAGAAWVHLVDLDAAFGNPPQTELLAWLAVRGGELGLQLQLGGGLRDGAAVARALDAGFARAVVGSLVARDPQGFGRLAERHPGRLVPALDISAARDELRIAGWTEAAARTVDAVCATLRGLPCPAVLVTDIDRDGTLDGPNLALARRVAAAAGIPALLSGGVRSLMDLRVAARAPDVAGAVVGKALYEGLFTVPEALAACRRQGER
jgi:phosphoribosylformimino-5-aminoimidazole carboxamide ribotide isomerase